MTDLISLLDSSKRTGHGRWLARCPAHDDKRPSLSVSQTDDGTWLLKCWAGCENIEIVRALGIEFADLFPEGQIRRMEASRTPRITAAEKLELVEHELGAATIVLSDVLDNRSATENHWQRLADAYRRLGRIRNG